VLEWKIPYIMPALGYYSPKYMKIDYWFVGLVNRVLQLLIFAYVLYSLINTKAWAYHEAPLGTVNAYAGAGADFMHVGQLTTDAIGALPYCNNETHAYRLSAMYNYDMPECKYVIPEQLVSKGNGQVSIVTMFTESTYFGWPCANDPTNVRHAPERLPVPQHARLRLA
jgi:hypothetical protein